MNKISVRPPLVDLGRTLKSAREKRKLTQRAFAAASAFQQAQIARAERGADIRASTLIELARALGLELKLVPQTLVPIIDTLIQNENSTEERPLYALEGTQ